MSKVVLMLVLTAAVLPAPVAAQGEAAPPPIRLGMTAALSGPAQSLGTGMKIGIESYFDRVNWDGGVHGRKLELIVMDDGYVPEAAMRNMHALIDEE
ncbi:MAG: ABC transporter substrate-binding protein, partial [Gammaproteobacteria bacterium]